MHHDHQEQPQHIYQQMSLPSLDLLGRIYSPRLPVVLTD